VPANANALIEARSYRGHRDPTLSELGAQLGRLIVAARLRSALPPRQHRFFNGLFNAQKAVIP
jgi:hypothetical protein